MPAAGLPAARQPTCRQAFLPAKRDFRSSRKRLSWTRLPSVIGFPGTAMSRLLAFPLSALLAAVLHSAAFAGDSMVEPSAATDISAPATPATQLLLGKDSNGDGIRDDVAALVPADVAATDRTTNPSGPANDVVNKLNASLKDSTVSATVTTDRPDCFTYTKLDPADQADADLFVRARGDGVFGTHPCDPQVSPLLDRPFEDSYTKLPAR